MTDYQKHQKKMNDKSILIKTFSYLVFVFAVALITFFFVGCAKPKQNLKPKEKCFDGYIYDIEEKRSYQIQVDEQGNLKTCNGGEIF